MKTPAYYRLVVGATASRLKIEVINIKDVIGKTALIYEDIDKITFEANLETLMTSHNAKTIYVSTNVTVLGDSKLAPAGPQIAICDSDFTKCHCGFTNTSDVEEGKMSNGQVEDLLTFLVNNNQTDDAKKLSKLFKANGLTLDVEPIVNPPLPEKLSDIKPGSPMTAMKFISQKYPAPKPEDCGFYVDKEIWQLLVRNRLRGQHTMITGPTGTGKTELVDLVCRELGETLSIQDMGTVQDAQAALQGTHRLDEKGKSIFDYAPFVSHIKSGNPILLDELNRAPLAANNILFPCLDSRRYLPVDVAISGEERHVILHKNTMFFATANLGAEYSGTSAIDRALLDRFFPVELDYPTVEQETKILVLRTKIDARIAGSIAKVVHTIRKQFNEEELTSTVSVRHALQAAGLVADGMDTLRALEYTIMPLFEKSNGGGSDERKKVKATIAAF